MKMLRGLLACVALAVLPAHAQKECTKAEAAAADKAVDRVVNYAGLTTAIAIRARSRIFSPTRSCG